MTRTAASSPSAKMAKEMIDGLQLHFVKKMQALPSCETNFEPVEWLRDQGTHGGGIRFEARCEKTFNRGSINMSQIHYDDQPEKKLSSATALSAIIHPHNPHCPSMHMHISWTEMKNGKGYWRIMGDLNPSIAVQADTMKFSQAMQMAAAHEFDRASEQGDKYFFIPALNRHRGATHFYLEQYATENPQSDLELAEKFGHSVINAYQEIVESHLDDPISEQDRQSQLDYHSLYLLQVLTLDRGTTSGLLVHSENDVGIMGSIPAQVNRELLLSWVDLVPKPQDELLNGLIECLPRQTPAAVTITEKQKMAHWVRQFYQKHPKALEMQASGFVIPPTVQNHRS